MSNFPTQFSQELTQLTVLDQSEWLQQLHEKDYELWAGLTPEYVDKIAVIAAQQSIREYCPKDLTARFHDRQMAEGWQQKGRGMFLLLQRTDNGLALAGYGWAGPETCPLIPEGQTTFAVRVSEDYQGQGLATPFSAAIIAAASQLYSATNFWLETWQSNAGAVHVYQKLGFQLVQQQPSERPTADGQSVADTRLYMTLPN